MSIPSPRTPKTALLRTKTLCISTLCFLSVVAVLATACGDSTMEEARPLRPLRHEVVGYLGGAMTRTFSGTAETGSVVNLSFRSGGVVTES